jgi:hypothetical protein
MVSIDAEEVADHWEFDSGPDEYRDQLEATRRYVKNARERPKTTPRRAAQDAPVEPHPDGFQAAETRSQQRTAEQVRLAYQQQGRPDAA